MRPPIICFKKYVTTNKNHRPIAAKSQCLRKPREDHHIEIPILPDRLLHLLPHQVLPRHSMKGISPYKTPFPLSVKLLPFQVVSRTEFTSSGLQLKITMNNNT